MYRILIADTLPESVLERYDQFPDIAVDNRAGISPEELKAALPEYDGLVVRSRTRVTAEVLEAGSRLKVIGRAGAGVDNIDTTEATRRGIIVMNTPGGNTIAATEHTIALMLAALRNVPSANASLREGKWDRKSYLGQELFEKTVGIIGLGKIGREVARRLSAFGATLLGYDPILTREMADRLGVELVGLEELLRRSDIITIHAPRIPETINLINGERLALCKDGVVLVNCARGGIVNEGDLLAGLNSGKVAAAALDVFEQEPPENWELVQHPRVVATPHLGASTREAQTKVADQILQQMIEYFRTGVALNAVNFISVDAKLQPIITPYYELAHRLGLLFSKIRKGRLKEVAIRFYGKVSELPLEPIASHLMAGALKAGPQDGDSLDVDFLNMVNSLAIAREKGIEIEITRKDHHHTGHTNIVAGHFATEEETVYLAGSVLAKGIYRLVQLNEYDVDADLDDDMVIIENEDVPGIIGKVGTLLGEAGINISHVSSGRIKEKKTAVNIFNVEGQWEPDLPRQLEGIDHVRRVWLVRMNETT